MARTHINIDQRRLKAFGLAVAAMFAANASIAEPAAETGPCSLEDAIPATVAVIDDDFELLLDDGRRVVVSGLEFPKEPKLRADAERVFFDLLSGKDIFIRALSSVPDRWGRTPAVIFAASKAGDLVSVGAILLSQGLARFRPDPSADRCAGAYRVAEAEGRARHRGLWADKNYAIINLPPQLDRIFEGVFNLKGMMLIEGVVSSVGQAGGITYLNFGPRRNQDFALVISRRNLVMFERVGVVPHALTGRRVRARGLIDTHFGPRMELAAPAQLELLDDHVKR